MHELQFKRAGHLRLVRHRDGKVFQAMGIVVSIEPLNLNRSSVTVTDGNNTFDYTFSGQTTGGVTVNLNSFNPSFWAALVSAETKVEQSARIPRYEEIAVPTTAPYTVNLKRTPVAGSIAVVDINNEPFTEVPSSPVDEGEFALNTDTLEFSSADAGKKLYVTYDVEVQKAFRAGITGEESLDVFELTIMGEAIADKNEGLVKADAIVFDSVIPLGDINQPQRSKDMGGWSVSFTLQPPRPGRKAVDYIVED